MLKDSQRFIKNNFIEEEGAFSSEEIDRCTIVILHACKVEGEDIGQKADIIRQALSTTATTATTTTTAAVAGPSSASNKRLRPSLSVATVTQAPTRVVSLEID